MLQPAGSRLAGLTPKDVSALQFGRADHGPAHAARLPGAPVHISARPTRAVRRCTVVVFGAYRDDLAAPQSDFHQLHQVGPCRIELGLTDRPAGPIRVDAMSEQQLIPVNVADP